LFIYNKKFFSILKKRYSLPNNFQKKRDLAVTFNNYFDLNYFFTKNLSTDLKFLKFIDLNKKTFKYTSDSFYSIRNLFFLKKIKVKSFFIFLLKNKRLFNKIRFFFMQFFLIYLIIKNKFAYNMVDSLFFLQKKYLFLNRIDVESRYLSHRSFVVEFFYYKFFFLYLLKLKYKLNQYFLIFKRKNIKILNKKKELSRFFYIITNNYIDRNNSSLFFFSDFYTLSIFLIHKKTATFFFDSKFKFMHSYLFNLYF
jgi:hypothetical protein